jgi:xanthine dehydrogenase accessory factor
MDRFYDKLAELTAAGDTVAVATIVDVRGSVPREVGAKMIIHPLGRHIGTVGGGCGEADVIRTALDVLQTGDAATVHVDLTEDISMQTLGVCGGVMDVFIARAEGFDLGDGLQQAARVAALRESTAQREPVALATVVAGSKPGSEAVFWLDRAPLGSLGLGDLEARVLDDARAALVHRQHKLLRYPEAGATVFVEVQRRAPELLIVGAGHIAQPLAQVAALCDFAVTVLDDRVAFANRERFPTARQVIAAPMRETVRHLAMDADTYIVLVTRGHSHDVECLLEVLDRPVGYIGMIGSQRRVDAVCQLLEEEQGIAPEKFDRIHAPIGIDIGARTPAEIAVCIVAEMINVQRGGPALSLSDRRIARDRARRERGRAERQRSGGAEGVGTVS